MLLLVSPRALHLLDRRPVPRHRRRLWLAAAGVVSICFFDTGTKLHRTETPGNAFSRPILNSGLTRIGRTLSASGVYRCTAANTRIAHRVFVQFQFLRSWAFSL